jgi:toxin ParE1/3/4
VSKANGRETSLQDLFSRRARRDHREKQRPFLSVYAETLSLAIGVLAKGPEIFGTKRRDEIGHGILTLHVARQGRKGRHFVVFRISGATTIDVLRLLHDSMDLARHLLSTGQ